MSLSDYTYGTLGGVFRRVGWLTEGRQYFDGDTLPSLEDVEASLDDIAADIHSKLAANGYAIDTNSDLTTNSPRAQRWLQALNEDGTAAYLCQTSPIAGNPDTGENNPAAFWSSKYRNGLKLIDKGTLDNLGMSKSTYNYNMLFSGSSEDSDGNTKLPVFTRAMFDNPNSRSLTE